MKRVNKLKRLRVFLTRAHWRQNILGLRWKRKNSSNCTIYSQVCRKINSAKGFFRYFLEYLVI